MINVYVIESILDNTWYTGMAVNENKRLKEHNAGKNRFTKGHRPWKIIYTETYEDWAAARHREKYLKSAAGKIWLQKWLNYHGGITGFPACVTQSGRQGFPRRSRAGVRSTGKGKVESPGY